MKLQTHQNSVERFGTSFETEFSIKTTAKAFDILSSGIYADSILAIIRELSCNAYDSHVSFGIPDEPFVVHLPNNNEPWFSVIDYGTGLSDEDIRGSVSIKEVSGEKVEYRTGGLYTTYFDSNKSDSNDFIGALGLGSKSPFSYTKSFDVISIHGGTKNIYSVFLNEDLIPTVVLLSSKSTNEESGFEVRVPVTKTSDFSSFHNKLKKAVRWFPVKPIVVGVLKYEFYDLPKEYLNNNIDYFFKDNKKSYRPSECYIIQGNVEYKVNPKLIQEQFKLTNMEKAILENTSLYIKVNIGEIDIAPSREEIRYSKVNISVIRSKLQQIKNDIFKQIENMATKHTSYWNFLLKLIPYIENIFSEYYKIKQIHILLKEYNGTHKHLVRAANSKHFVDIDYNKFQVYLFSKSYITNIGYKKQNVFNLNDVLRYTSIIVFADCRFNASKIRQSFQTYKVNYILVFQNIDNRRLLNDQFLPLANSLGNPTYYLLSKLQQEKQKYVNTKSIPVYKCQTYEFSKTIRSIDDIKYYYYVRNRTTMYQTYKIGSPMIGSVKHYGSSSANHVLTNIIKFINISSDRNISGKDVFGVGISGNKILEKDNTKQNIFDLFEQEVLKNKSKIINQNKVENFNKCKLKPMSTSFIDLSKVDKHIILKQMKQLSKNSLFKKKIFPVLNDINNQNYSNDVISAVFNISKRCNYIDNSNLTDDTYCNSTEIEELLTQYPMLFVLITHSNYYSFQLTNIEYLKLIEYIKLVDLQQ